MSTSTQDMSDDVPVVKEIIDMLNEKKLAEERRNQEERLVSKKNDMLRMIQNFGNNAMHVPVIFSNINDIGDNEIKSFLRAKLIAKFLVSLDVPNRMNQRKFLQEYKNIRIIF